MLEQHLQIGDVLIDFELGPDVKGGGDEHNRRCNTGVVEISVEYMRRKWINKKLGRLTFNEAGRFTTPAFTWLPFSESRINWGATAGKDVLSGYFSGCWMSKYTEDGTKKVAHIYCQDDDTDCKPHWRAHKANIDVESEFKPDDHKKGSGDKIFGLFTNTGERYAISCKRFNPELVNTFTREDWVNKFTSEGKISAHDIDAAAAHCADQRKCTAEQMYGFCWEITGFEKVAPEHFPD